MTSPLLDNPLYIISDIKLSTSPIVFSQVLNYTFRIEISNNATKLVKSAEGILRKNQVVWNDQITLSDVTTESAITLNILRKKKRGGMETIGKYVNTVSGLLAMQTSSGVCEADLGEKGRLSFTIKRTHSQAMLDERIQPIMDIHFEGGESWSTFLSYFRTVKTVVDPVTGLNPNAQQAWKILSAIPELIQGHITRNSNVEKLLQRLMDIYKYINEADRLPVLTDSQSEKLKLLIEKTCDCADFIKKYTENNAAQNFMEGPVFDEKISEFEESFDQLFKTIQGSLMLGIRLSTSNIGESNLLREMPHAENAGFVDGKKCLPGTRQKLIEEILEWVDNKNARERVFVLSGQAGMGKSAVAHTIAETFRTQNRLYSFFCFSRSDRERRNILFSTISRHLADHNALWRQNLVHAIEETAIRKSFDPVTQFNEMIIKPSRSIEMTEPVVIVIDALDESGDRFERQTLLDLLFKRSSELSSNCQFLITSRPEPDIASFYQHSNVFCKHMTEVNSDDTLSDIRQFISHKLFAVKEVLDNELEIDWGFVLAERAQGLFQWANLACLYIDPTVTFGVVERLRIVISRTTPSIYELYHEILDNQPEFRMNGYFSMFRMIIGTIVVARKPLSVIALQALFGHVIKDVRDVLRPFHSLFIGVNDSATQIRPLHASLLDFFISAEQNPGTQNRYYISTLDQSFLTHACLRVMNTMLRFNICDLETSHSRNRDVPNFDSRVAKAIPLQLSYACCFWAYHLECSQLNPDLLKEIRDLMHNKLLYFFEALSLLGEIEQLNMGASGCRS